MNISRVELTNFRGIEHLELILEGKSTVFFGINGVGKSSVFGAIDLLYANIIGGVLGSKKRFAQLTEDDIFKRFSRINETRNSKQMFVSTLHVFRK